MSNIFCKHLLLTYLDSEILVICFKGFFRSYLKTLNELEIPKSALSLPYYLRAIDVRRELCKEFGDKTLLLLTGLKLD